jgi:hypothetical protein
MDPFVEQLASLCRDQVTRNKWVFVPSHALGRTLGERLALSGTNWLNLRFVTPLDIALRMGAPFLVERGIDPSEEGLGPALIMRLLLDLPAEGGYFRPLADQPSLAQALWTTIRELRMAGITSTDLTPEAFASPAKHTELAALLAFYEQFLASNKRGDMALVYEEALKHSDWCPIQSQDCWTELPDSAWMPLQRQLLEAMPGEHIVPRTLAIAGGTIPRRFRASQVDRCTANAGTAPLASLLAPGTDTGGGARGTAAAPVSGIDLFSAGGREAEVEEVFRRILASGTSLDQVEIACASSGYDTLIWEKALRLEWPTTLGTGLPIECTRPGRALLGFCAWIESDFVASHLRRLLESGDIRFRDLDDLTPGQAARLLVKSQAGWGRGTYGLALGKLKRSYEGAAINPDLAVEVQASSALKAARTGRLRDWIDALVVSVPEEEKDGTVLLSDAVRAALGFLDSAAATASAVDHLAAASVAESIGELRSLGTFRRSGLLLTTDAADD